MRNDAASVDANVQKYHPRNLLRPRAGVALCVTAKLAAKCSYGSFTSFPPSRRVRFAPRADVRTMPAFMSRRFTGKSRAADAGCLYGFNTQHDPWRASSLAWRTGGDDNGFLGALEPVDLLFEFCYPLLALGQRTRRVSDPINLGHQPFNQHIRFKKGHQYVHVRWPLHGERFIHTTYAPNDRPRQTLHVSSHFLADVRRRNRHALQRRY